MLCIQWYEISTTEGKMWPIPLICPEGAWAMGHSRGQVMQIDTGPGEIIASVLAGLGGLGLLFRKYISLWFKGGADIERERANESLMQNFRVEIDRLSKLNNDLADRLAEMQTENITLRQEIGELRNTILRLERNYGSPLPEHVHD